MEENGKHLYPLIHVFYSSIHPSCGLWLVLAPESIGRCQDRLNETAGYKHSEFSQIYLPWQHVTKSKKQFSQKEVFINDN